MIVDPPVRLDGLCHVCLKPRPVPKGVWARDAAEVDPFCSSTWARSFHGQPDLNQQANESRKQLTAENRSSSFIPNNTKHGTRESYELCACEACTAAVKGAA